VQGTPPVGRLLLGVRSVACQSRSPSLGYAAQLAICTVAKAPMCPKLALAQGRK
jgi:hypothetical protein